MMRDRADGYWKEYLALPRSAEERQLADAAQEKRLALQKRVDRKLQAIAAARARAHRDRSEGVQAAYNELSNANDALRKHLMDRARAGYETAQQTFGLFRTVSLLAIAASSPAAFGVLAPRLVARPLDEALGHFDAIAARRPAPHTCNVTLAQTKWAQLLRRASRRCSSSLVDGSARRCASGEGSRSPRRPSRSRAGQYGPVGAHGAAGGPSLQETASRHGAN